MLYFEFMFYNTEGMKHNTSNSLVRERKRRREKQGKEDKTRSCHVLRDALVKLSFATISIFHIYIGTKFSPLISGDKSRLENL
jgi:hypothetical protein